MSCFPVHFIILHSFTSIPFNPLYSSHTKGIEVKLHLQNKRKTFECPNPDPPEFPTSIEDELNETLHPTLVVCSNRAPSPLLQEFQAGTMITQMTDDVNKKFEILGVPPSVARLPAEGGSRPMGGCLPEPRSASSRQAPGSPLGQTLEKRGPNPKLQSRGLRCICHQTPDHIHRGRLASPPVEDQLAPHIAPQTQPNLCTEATAPRKSPGMTPY